VILALAAFVSNVLAYPTTSNGGLTISPTSLLTSAANVISAIPATAAGILRPASGILAVNLNIPPITGPNGITVSV
jgi:hypothetical protein